jgi:energy-coupling factor transport system permease protein
MHHLHPLTNLALTGLLIFSALLLPTVWAPYLVFLLAVVPLALWSGVLRPMWSAVWRLVLPFAISVTIIQGLFWSNGTPIVALGPLSVKQEGLLFALEITGNILAMISSFVLFSLVTRPDDLMIALTEKGVPNSITYIIVSTIQLVPGLQVRAAKIRDAQHARGLETEGGILTRVRALPPLIEPLVLGSIIDVDERAIALEARAFSSTAEKTSLRQIEDSRGQLLLRWACLLLMVGFVLLRLFWPWVSGRLGVGV